MRKLMFALTALTSLLLLNYIAKRFGDLVAAVERSARDRARPAGRNVQQIFEILPVIKVEDLKKGRREHLEAQERIEELKQERWERFMAAAQRINRLVDPQGHGEF